MLFSRHSNDGTNETYYSLVRKPPIITSALTLSVAAATLLSTAPGGARRAHHRVASDQKSHPRSPHSSKATKTAQVTKTSEQKLIGVWGWTTGSQTYLRVRPSAAVPAVAKVPRHTKLMVWGTYDGWYRVETPDHIFGWVYHPYINAPARARLSELSHRKAKVASDRAAHQTMYGSADVLLRYYAQYGAPGAWRGLKKQGVQLAATAKPKSTLQTASRISKPQSDGITVAKSPNRQALSKITARPAMAPRPRTTPHIAAATTAKAAPKPVQAARPKAAKPSWRAIAWKRRQLRQQQQREQLRRRMGTPVMTAPPLSSPALPPISPEELMNAREAYVVSRNKNNAPAVQPGAPGGLTRGNGGLSDENSASLRPSSFTGGRASQPKGQVPLNRGGSPRDLFKHAAKPSPFSQGLVDQALSYRGMPYIRGAESPRRGFDCSGLVYFLLRQRGYNPPRTAAGYIRYGQAVPKDQLQPGDILLFSNTYKRGISHMGIYVGNGRFVHAARTGKGVRTDYLSSSYYGHKYYGARRVKSR